MMPPTIASLRAVARFATAAEALAAAAEITDVPTILPRIIVDDGGVRIVLPGDPEYDEGYTRRGAARPAGRRSDERSRLRGDASQGEPGAIGGVMLRAVDPEPVAPDAPKPIVTGVASALSPLVRRIVARQPGDDDRPGHQHLPGRHRRDRRDRPGSRTTPPTSTPSPAAAATASAGSCSPTPTPTTRPAPPA